MSLLSKTRIAMLVVMASVFGCQTSVNSSNTESTRREIGCTGGYTVTIGSSDSDSDNQGTVALKGYAVAYQDEREDNAYVFGGPGGKYSDVRYYIRGKYLLFNDGSQESCD